MEKDKIEIGSSYERDGIVWTIIDEKGSSGSMNDRPFWVIRKVEPMERTEANYNMGFITQEMYEGTTECFNITEENWLKFGTAAGKYFNWSKVF